VAGQRRKRQLERAEGFHERAEELAHAAAWLRDVLIAQAEAEEKLEDVRLELRAAVSALHRAGASFDEIGTMIGVSRQRAQQFAQEYAEHPTGRKPKSVPPAPFDLILRYAEAPESLEDVMKPFPEHPAQTKLTETEERMLTMLSEGETIADIGQELGLSKQEIRSDLASLYAKLGVTTRAEILRLIRDWR
jgi:DNA-binding NarL/FixJ family response regulator